MSAERKTAQDPEVSEDGKDRLLLPPDEVTLICPPQDITVVVCKPNGEPKATFTVQATDRPTLAVAFALCRYLRGNQLKGYMKLPAIQDAFAEATAPNLVRVRASLRELQQRSLMDSSSREGYIPRIALIDLEGIATSPEQTIHLVRLTEDDLLPALRGLKEYPSMDVRHQLRVFILSEALPEGGSLAEAHRAAAAAREAIFRDRDPQDGSQGSQPKRQGPAPVTRGNKPGLIPGSSWSGPRSVESKAPNRFTEQFPRFAQMLGLHGSELTGTVDQYILSGFSLNREQVEILKDQGNPGRTFRELLVSLDSATDPKRMELRNKLIHELRIFCCLPQARADCHSIEDILTAFLEDWGELITPSQE